MRHRLNRRRFLGVTAGAAAAAATAQLGPTSVFAAPQQVPDDNRLIPTGKVGTITFTQRDVPGRLGVAASAAMGVPPTMGFVGGPDFPEDLDDLGPLVPLPGGWRELFEFLANVRVQADRVRRVRAERRQPRRHGQLQPEPGGPSRVPRPRADTARLPRRVRAGGDRQPWIHPEHLARTEQPGRRDVGCGLPAIPDRVGVRGDSRHALHGYRRRPDERQQPQHRAMDGGRREVGRAQHARASNGASTSTRTTTRRPTTSSRTARW